VSTPGPTLAEVKDCRPAVERVVAELPEAALVPREEGEISFSAPWELRAFSVAVAAHLDGRFEWPEFQQELVAAIATWEQTPPAERVEWSYYREWVRALETLVLERGLVSEAEVEERTAEYLGGVRDPKHH
jgi:nitrile hydratase accessory protein